MANWTLNHLANGSNASTSSISVASQTWYKNRLYIIYVYNKKDPSGSNPPVLSGLPSGVSFTQVLQLNSTKTMATVFVCVPTSSTTGGFSIGWSGDTPNNTNYSLDEIIGSNLKAGSGSVVQSKITGYNNPGSGTNWSVTLDSTPKQANLIYAGSGLDMNDSYTPPSGFTEDWDGGNNSTIAHGQTTNTTLTFQTGSSQNPTGNVFALEIKAGNQAGFFELL